jgi:8-oxo-dGTP pyrophosphatase MutT (NUDIX family)
MTSTASGGNNGGTTDSGFVGAPTRRGDNNDAVDAGGAGEANRKKDATAAQQFLPHRRVWKAGGSRTEADRHWTHRVIDTASSSDAEEFGSSGGSGNTAAFDAVPLLFAAAAAAAASTGVPTQTQHPHEPGRMRPRQLGVLHEDPATDMQLLMDNYTVRAVASALRDREDALQQAAQLSANGQIDDLRDFLQIFHPRYVQERRQRKPNSSGSGDATADVLYEDTDPTVHLRTDASRQRVRKALMRMPRTITTAHVKRAAVCVALCLVSDADVPSLLLEKRASHLRSHPDEVCLPGGMVCDVQDPTIVSTSIREMKEEIHGLDGAPIEVLGVLRLNWGEVQHLTGIAVTPVVCYLGRLSDNAHLAPQAGEVAEIFTVPLTDLLEPAFWVHKEGVAPIFMGGPYPIYGLTGYILERFGKDILKPLRSQSSNNPAAAPMAPPKPGTPC